jgi:hypothetical protein
VLEEVRGDMDAAMVWKGVSVEHPTAQRPPTIQLASPFWHGSLAGGALSPTAAQPLQDEAAATGPACMPIRTASIMPTQKIRRRMDTVRRMLELNRPGITDTQLANRRL